MVSLEHMTIGSRPAGFTFARTGQGGEGEWTVTADTTAAGGRAIEQISTERTDYRFPLAIHDSFPLRTSTLKSASMRWPARSTRPAALPCA
jgi:hypothetical protein